MHHLYYSTFYFQNLDESRVFLTPQYLSPSFTMFPLGFRLEECWGLSYEEPVEFPPWNQHLETLPGSSTNVQGTFFLTNDLSITGIRGDGAGGCGLRSNANPTTTAPHLTFFLPLASGFTAKCNSWEADRCRCLALCFLRSLPPGLAAFLVVHGIAVLGRFLEVETGSTRST